MLMIVTGGGNFSALADEPDKSQAVRDVTVVVTEHVILHDGKIVDWEDVERIFDNAAEETKIHPQFYMTNGALPREEEVREFRWRVYKKLWDAGKVDGITIGSLSPRTGERLDQIETSDDLIPDQSKKLDGTVLDTNGRPVEGVEVFLLPEKHINGVYIRDGRIRNPYDEHLTETDDSGSFVLFSEEGETQIAAIHPTGFVITSLEKFRQSPILKLKKWARVFGKQPAFGENDEQSVSFTCYPVPGISFHIYETEILQDGSFEQKFVPPGKVTISRTVPTDRGGSRSTPYQTDTLLPGESYEVEIDAIRKP